MDTDLKQKIDYYLGFPYTMNIAYREDQGGYYVASYIELPDLTMTGATPEEAVKELLGEKPEWLETCLKLGIEIPMPVQNKKYSGKIALRMSPSMHAAVTHIAELEGISLNQYMVTTIARAIGHEEAHLDHKPQKKEKQLF